VNTMPSTRLKTRHLLPAAAVIVLATPLMVLPVHAQIRGAGDAPTGLTRRTAEAPAGTGAYRLHSGDQLVVNFRFTPEFNDEVTVQPDGHGQFRSAGDLKLEGLTISEVRARILAESTSKLVNPEFTVTLKDFERPHIFVAGEVITPGRQDLRRPITAMQAVLAAGGPKEDAAMGRVVLFRRIDSEMSEVHILKLGSLKTVTRAQNDMVLQPDDLVLVGHDHLQTIGRYIKTANLGIYLQPLSSSPVF